MALGIGSQGGFAVPFQLDPAIMLTSAGTVDPMRKISRVVTGTAKEYDFVSSAGVTINYVSERTEVGTGDPQLAQPIIRPQRLHSFVPFSIELDVTWGAAVQELTRLLTDAADIADAQAHIVGSGTAPQVQGVVTGMQGASNNILTKVAGTGQDRRRLRVAKGGPSPVPAPVVIHREPGPDPACPANGSCHRPVCGERYRPVGGDRSGRRAADAGERQAA